MGLQALRSIIEYVMNIILALESHVTDGPVGHPAAGRVGVGKNLDAVFAPLFVWRVKIVIWIFLVGVPVNGVNGQPVVLPVVVVQTKQELEFVVIIKRYRDFYAI